MTDWLVVLAAGLGSYALRVSMIMMIDRTALPPQLGQASPLVAPAAFAALATTGIAEASLAVGAVHALPSLAAAAVAVLAVQRTGSSHAAVLTGMPTLWILNALLAEVGAG